MKCIYKIHDAKGRMIATTAYAEDAAALVSFYDGGRVKVNGRVVFKNPGDPSGIDPGESFDAAGDLMRERRLAHHRERMERYARRTRELVGR